MADNTPKFSLDEDISLCRNYKLYYPKKGEERRMNGIMSQSYWGKIHEQFFAGTGNPHNRDYIALLLRFGKIKSRVVEFMALFRIVKRYRLRGETYEDTHLTAKNEWRRWKRKNFKYEDHFRILVHFFVSRFGY